MTDFTPEFGHLPMVTGEGNKKLSKRDATSNLFLYRDRGFLPAGLLNYLAPLGWSIAEDRDIFSMAEMFDTFDIKKAEAINGTHLRALPVEEFVSRALPYLAADGVLPAEPSVEQVTQLAEIAPLVQERLAVEASTASLDALDEWTAPAIEETTKSSLVDGLGLKPRKAYAPVRIAVTGRTVSPPLCESMQLLGRVRSIG